MNNFTVVPVLLGFDNERVVGELKILTDALPVVPEFVFSIGFTTLGPCETKAGDTPTKSYVGPYHLTSVSIVQDMNYAGYLRQIGKIPNVFDVGVLEQEYLQQANITADGQYHQENVAPVFEWLRSKME